MMPWTADVEVTSDLARSLIAPQFAQFANAAIEPLGEGWDNAAFLVDADFVFRFPRREISGPLLATEIAVLPAIAREVPFPISTPVFAGKPAGAYRWPFAGYRRLPGTTMSSVRLDAAAYDRIAASLGTFLHALHRVDARPLRDAGLPGDEIGRLDHARRMPKLDQRLAELQAAGFIAGAQPFLDVLEAVSPTGARPERLTVVHGDLYARHVMIDAGDVAGIIDWGDVHYGDPAVDVSIVYEILPMHAREAFERAYGTIDDDTRRLARYRAIYHAALVAHYGYHIQNGELLDAGLTGLKYALL